MENEPTLAKQFENLCARITSEHSVLAIIREVREGKMRLPRFGGHLERDYAQIVDDLKYPAWLPV